MKRTYQITKLKGAAVDVAAALDLLRIWLDAITPGIYVLKLERKPSIRSVSQNRLMWLWFAAIAEGWSDATGRVYTAQDAHDFYCLMFLPKVSPDGERYGGSTSGLTVDEMTVFLDRIKQHALEEYSIDLPNPDALQFEAWAEQYDKQ